MKLTLIGMYNFTPTLFDGLVVPPSIDKESLVNTILLNYGEMPVIYSDVEFTKFAIGAWSKKWYQSIERIYTALSADYNPVHNYDRTEEFTDTRSNNIKNSGSDSVSGDTSTNSNGTDTTQNDVSAYNSSTYQPDNRTTDNTSSHATTTDNTTTAYGRQTDENETTTHKARLFGNIGVTTAESMILEELALRMKYNVYDIIAELFKTEFLILIY